MKKKNLIIFNQFVFVFFVFLKTAQNLSKITNICKYYLFIFWQSKKEKQNRLQIFYYFVFKKIKLLNSEAKFLKTNKQIKNTFYNAFEVR